MRNRTQGFTLLEVLVALVIVVASSSIVLSHISTLMTINGKVRDQQQEVTELLNQTAEFRFFDFKGVRLTVKPPVIEMYSKDGKQVARIENFTHKDKNLPPVDKLYTPYQIYGINRPHRQIALLLPGMMYGDQSSNK